MSVSLEKIRPTRQVSASEKASPHSQTTVASVRRAESASADDLARVEREMRALERDVRGLVRA